MANQLTIYNGRSFKAVSPWNVDSDVGWTVYGEGDRGAEAAYFRHVPWLYRAVRDRSNNVGKMPFAVMRKETVIDESGKYTNWLKFLPNPRATLRLLEMSLAVTGRAYLFLETNRSGYIISAKYCIPTSIDVVRDRATNEITGYTRQVGNKTFAVAKANLLALYDPDFTVEDGPGDSSAAKAALLSAGVLYSADQFIKRYFESGAIKATILSVDGGNKDEAERLQHWWHDVVAGIKHAWTAIVLRLKGVVATVIGEGLESLQNEQLTTERRQNIATALGVPESKMWSSAANYATRVEDEKAYYQGTIIPECELIAEGFNSQVFTKEHNLEGVRLEFLPETLEIFHEDRAAQATAAKGFADFLAACPTAEIALQTALLVGFEISDELEKAIVDYYAQKEERAATIQENIANAQANPTANEESQGQNQGENLPQGNVQEEPPEPNPAELRAALSAWKRKAIHLIERGEVVTAPFYSSVIPRRTTEAIRYELEGCTTADQVKAVFETVITAMPVPADLAGELKRANDLLEKALT